MHYNALNTGKRIQKLRKDKGLTQEQLAERLNLSTVHMAKIETGQSSCSLDVLTEFAMFFNASLDYLVLGKITEKELRGERGVEQGGMALPERPFPCDSGIFNGAGIGGFFLSVPSVEREE